MRVTRRDEDGQTTILVLGLALVTFAVAGLAVDGTRAFLHRRTLQNAADSAALAAAGEVDRDLYYSSAGRTVMLDPHAAATAAGRWLRRRGIRATASFGVSRNSVGVTLTGSVPTTFLGLVGIGEIRVAARATAEPETGSPAGEG